MRLLLLLLLLSTPAVLSASPEALADLPGIPRGASCPQSILRPSLIFYLTPFVIAVLVCNRKIVSDVRLIYGN